MKQTLNKTINNVHFLVYSLIAFFPVFFQALVFIRHQSWEAIVNLAIIGFVVVTIYTLIIITDERTLLKNVLSDFINRYPTIIFNEVSFEKYVTQNELTIIENLAEATGLARKALSIIQGQRKLRIIEWQISSKHETSNSLPNVIATYTNSINGGFVFIPRRERKTTSPVQFIIIHEIAHTLFLTGMVQEKPKILLSQTFLLLILIPWQVELTWQTACLIAMLVFSYLEIRDNNWLRKSTEKLQMELIADNFALLVVGPEIRRKLSEFLLRYRNYTNNSRAFRPFYDNSLSEDHNAIRLSRLEDGIDKPQAFEHNPIILPFSTWEGYWRIFLVVCLSMYATTPSYWQALIGFIIAVIYFIICYIFVIDLKTLTNTLNSKLSSRD